MQHWLKHTLDRQMSIYGMPHPNDMSKEEVICRVQTQVVAIVAELGELLREFDWKPWTKGPRGIDRDNMTGEMVDLLHFAANILVLVGCTDSELLDRYEMKASANAQRQAAGYTGKTCMEPVRQQPLSGQAPMEGLCKLPKGHDGRHRT